MPKDEFTMLIPCEGGLACACGAVKVSVFKDHLDKPEKLMDNMGCELGLEFVAGPFCPKCEAREIERIRVVSGE